MSRASRTNRVNVDSSLVENIQGRILRLLNNRKSGKWTGTMTELNAAITAGLRRATPTNWPKTPSFLRRVINATVPNLEKNGVRVEFGRATDHSRTRFVSFEQV